MACKNSPFMGSEGKFVPRQKSQCFWDITTRVVFLWPGGCIATEFKIKVQGPKKFWRRENDALWPKMYDWLMSIYKFEGWFTLSNTISEDCPYEKGNNRAVLYNSKIIWGCKDKQFYLWLITFARGNCLKYSPRILANSKVSPWWCELLLQSGSL